MTPADPRAAAMEQKIRSILDEWFGNGLSQSAFDGIMRDLLDALLALPVAETGWQASDTAPFNQPVLTTRRHGNMIVAVRGADEWLTGDWGNYISTPTHWMPLPAPPLPAPPEPPEGEAK